MEVYKRGILNSLTSYCTIFQLRLTALIMPPVPGSRFKVIIVLLWFFVCGKTQRNSCNHVTICVANENEAECQQGDTRARSIDQLLEAKKDCKSVDVHLTSGIHVLTVNLDFSDKVVNFQVASMGQLSTIHCKNGSGIQFTTDVANNSVVISNISFENCGRNQTIPYEDSSVQVALLFLRVSSYRLENVMVISTEGYGLYAYNCMTQIINHCKFRDNKGNVKIRFLSKKYNVSTNVSVVISNSSFSNGVKEGGPGGIDIYTPNDKVHPDISITSCMFRANEGDSGSHLLVKVNTLMSDAALNISNCNFSRAKGQSFGVVIGSTKNRNELKVTINSSHFNFSENGALKITQASVVKITNCSVTNNNGTGIFIDKRSFTRSSETKMITYIFDTSFQNNLRALYLNLSVSRSTELQQTNISNCKFTDHNMSSPLYKAVVEIQGNLNGRGLNNAVLVEKSDFYRNEGPFGNCFSLRICNMNNTVLDALNFSDNYCTGLALLDSNIKVHHLDMSRNRGMKGGAMQLNGVSRIHLTTESKVSIINNSASRYGGGIYTDESCEQGSRNCFFQFETIPNKPSLLNFAGNQAELGGDIVFGGCLSNCSINGHTIDVTNSSNIFWEFATSTHLQSPSTFAERAKRAVFCTNVYYNSQCSNSLALNAFRGQKFTIPLMVIGDSCIPSAEIIQAIIKPQKNKIAHLQDGQLHLGMKQCENYTFTIFGEETLAAVTLQIFIERDLEQSILNNSPTLLTVNLGECPGGFTSNGLKCDCDGNLKQYNIKCTATDYSITVPAFTWIGKFQGRVAVQKYCIHCKNTGEQILQYVKNESDQLCAHHRSGISCGTCVNGYSLQLGDNTCADCSNSTYKGVLLLLSFMVVGVALIMILICLNLTVSTGLLNGLIFYCNIVYSNSDTFLPINREQTNETQLQNAVQFFSTFQAWINLDFGINTCFFNGFDTYISTWMQFIFPMYIWFLVLLIVLASRLSSRVARLTTSHIVPVLATLLLLSYAKLLITVIAVCSFTTMTFLDGSDTRRVWIWDGNVLYLQAKHIPLFLMSSFMIVAYIIPFTLLILLGPLLQAKSEYRLLKWINKLKPFLDAFYGPYNGRYCYWPGLLLLARWILFNIFAFISLGDGPYKLLTVSIAIILLLVIWNVLGRHATSPHQKSSLDYLELFFHSNLAFFAIISTYFRFTQDGKLYKQQVLAIIMAGSVFIVFLCIVAFRIFCVLSWLKVTRKLIHYVNKTLRRDETACNNPIELNSAEDTSCTHSTVDVCTHGSLMTSPSFELREPLLTD